MAKNTILAVALVALAIFASVACTIAFMRHAEPRPAMPSSGSPPFEQLEFQGMLDLETGEWTGSGPAPMIPPQIIETPQSP